MGKQTCIVWLKDTDLRLADNPALVEAARHGAVVPVFVWSPELSHRWNLGSAARWWLHGSLLSLSDALHRRNNRLILRTGLAEEVLPRLAASIGAKRIYWNAEANPHARSSERNLVREIHRSGIAGIVSDSGLLHDPETLLTTKGTPYAVFTSFWNRFVSSITVPSPMDEPDLSNSAPEVWPDSTQIESLGLGPSDDRERGVMNAWQPGEEGAVRNLLAFLDDGLASYDGERNFPGRRGTSLLSPHLRFGEITSRSVWNAVSLRLNPAKAEPFLRQLVWREFAYHQLFHFPDSASRPLRPAFEQFPWRPDASLLRVWQEGITGYPIVDAGMRQLWTTGWMHKHLLQPWTDGADWFWETLVDADLANNTMGWQWSAGSGAYAQPYFRIFNPVLQGERFDPDGNYVRKWIPELARMPNKYLHHPWDAPAETLSKAGVQLERDYPGPVVNHRDARANALQAYESLRSGRTD
jgi:deoxyribodipyrimidine photo-lyase